LNGPEWTDLFGIAHNAGDVVDSDAVTLAELEEQRAVENVDGGPEEWSGPEQQDGEPQVEWQGPTEQEDADAGEAEEPEDQ
jgi:hypothetical protein